MTSGDDVPSEVTELRLRAEELVRAEAAGNPEDLAAIAPQQFGRIIHELRVHQIELEVQNEELRRVQAELDAARSRYFDLYELAPVGYCTISEAGLILEANLTAARLLGVARRVLVGQPLTSFIVSEDENTYYLHRKRLFETGEPEACEIRLRRAGTDPFWTRIEETVVRDADIGPIARMVISDITGRKQAESELQQVQKMESIGRLAGGVAHDFNNLLTVINGYSAMLLAQLESSDPLRTALLEIYRAGECAAGLTRQLLAFSRKQVLQPQRLDLSRVVEELRPMLERLVAENVELQVTLNTADCTIHADPNQLEQVIMNLVINARDAMPGHGRLLIETAIVDWDANHCRSHPETRAGRYVLLTVSDNGLGMDEATRLRIFEPFFTTKGVGKGTGLGLSMVQGIVAQSGGHIDVESRIGLGTSIKIYLPALDGEATGAMIPEVVPVLGGTETVLVVEDQPEVRSYAVAVLKKYGYRVLQAENADEALMICTRETAIIDLILTDMVMPNLNGRELAKRLKRLRPSAKVVFMSGYTGGDIEEESGLITGADFIHKPFSPQELAGRVRTVLGMRGPNER